MTVAEVLGDQGSPKSWQPMCLLWDLLADLVHNSSCLKLFLGRKFILHIKSITKYYKIQLFYVTSFHFNTRLLSFCEQISNDQNFNNADTAVIFSNKY